MSYIRPLEQRRFSKGDTGLYAFLGGDPRLDDPDMYIEDYGSMRNPENYVEITCRIMERAGIKLNRLQVNQLRKELHLEPLDEIKESEETWEDHL